MQNFSDNGKKDFVWGGWRKPYQYILDEAKTPEVAPEVSDVQESLGTDISLYGCGRKHYKEIRSILKDANKYQGPSGLDPLIHDAMINLEHLAVALAEPHSTPSVVKAVEDYRNKVFMSIRQFIRGVQANTRPSYFSGQRQFPLAMKIDKLLLKIQNCSQSFTTKKKARQSPTLSANPFKDLSVSESVSATKEYRQKKIQANRRLIVKLGTAAQKVEDTAARREITQTLSSADAYNRRLGTPEFLKYGPAYWVNFEGIYVGRELERVRSLLVHHGIVIPTSESVEESDVLTEEKEYILWAIPKGETDALYAKPVYTQGRSMDDIKKMMEFFKKQGWHSFKVQTIDLSEPMDAAKAFRKAINPPSKWRKPSSVKRESVEEGDAMTEAKRQPEENYFKSYTAAVNAARAKAEKKGYEIDEDDWSSKVTHGYPGRPSEGKTTNFKIRLLKGGKPVKNMLVVSVYGMSASFELTSYIS